MVLFQKFSNMPGPSCRYAFFSGNISPDYFFGRQDPSGYRKVPDRTGYQNPMLTGFGRTAGNVLK